MLHPGPFARKPKKMPVFFCTSYIPTVIGFTASPLSKIHTVTQEDAVSAIFRSHRFYYPVELTTEEAPPLAGFTWLKPSNFLKAMYKNNDLSHLLGGYSLTEAKGLLHNFWSKYRALFPRHQLWEDVDANRKDLSKCIPVFLHGDEGVHYRKSGLLVLSFQGVIGYGSSKRSKDLEEKFRATGEGVPINMLRTGFQTRMLVLVCPKEWVG